MGKSKEYPVNFTPRGICDAWDSTAMFPGACLALTNLIFDAANPEQVVARPGVGSAITSFAGITSPGVVSVQQSIGDVVYGMIASGLNVGYDQPFSYNQATNTFNAITGILAGNVPLTQLTTGEWTPPTLSMVGTKLIITHPGYSGAALNGSFTGAITGNLLTITGVVTGTVVPGSNVAGAGVLANTCIQAFISGVFGGAGVYLLNTTAGAPIAAEAMTATNKAFFGVLDITNPAAPVYWASNTGVFPLPSVPAAAGNFNNRAYFACGNSSYYSDVLLPLQMGAAGQALASGDGTPITAYSALPIQSTSAGAVSALIAFKKSQIWQITGDAAVTGTLAQNFLSLNIGTPSPRSIVQTPIGTIFIALDGPYYISSTAQVMPLTKDFQKLIQDIQEPFQNAVNPTRAAASYSAGTYRICLDTVIDGAPLTNDYWFDVTVRRWNGPHTFPYDTCSYIGNSFIITHRRLPGQMFLSQNFPSKTSVYNDNGVQLNVLMETSLFPKTQSINIKQVIESTIELSPTISAPTYTIIAVDENFNQIGTCFLNIFRPVTLWGSGAAWGSFMWSSSAPTPKTNSLLWGEPLVFKKIGLRVSAQSDNSLSIGAFFAKYMDCGYTNFN